MHNEKLKEMFPPPSQNTVGVCKQITLLILYTIIAGLVTLLKVIDAPVKVSGISHLWFRVSSIYYMT
jgi:hypothetical protein